MAEGGAAQQVPQQPEADVAAGALGDEVEVQHLGGAQAAVPQQRAQRRLRLVAERGVALRLGEHEQEVQPAGPRAGRGGRRGAQAAGGAGEGLAAAAQVVEGADGHGRGRRQGRGLRAAQAAPARRAPQRRHGGAAPPPGPARPGSRAGTPGRARTMTHHTRYSQVLDTNSTAVHNAKEGGVYSLYNYSLRGKRVFLHFTAGMLKKHRVQRNARREKKSSLLRRK